VSFFSVIITVYNKENYIKHTLNSVLKQSFQDFEVIVVNDGSTDNSTEIISAFKDKRITLISTKNQGASLARNTGIKKANSDYIALLDGDDLWEPDYLKYIHNGIIEHPEIKIFTTAIAQRYPSKTVPMDYGLKQQELFSIHNYFKGSKTYTLLSGSSIVFHKTVLEKTGLFDSTIVSGQDTDLWIRFGLHYKILFINKPLAIYNYNPNSLSNTTFDLKNKSKFNKYLEEEKQNPSLKAFLDQNRYSMSILSKFVDDSESFEYYKSHIDPKNLTLRQTLLLNSPKWLLRLLLTLKSVKGEKLYYPKN